MNSAVFAGTWTQVQVNMKEWWDKLFGAIHKRSRESDRGAPTLERDPYQDEGGEG